MAQRIIQSELDVVELLSYTPDFVKKSRKRRNRRFSAGIKYEKKLHKHLSSIYGFEYLSGVWFRYSFKKNPKQFYFAQTDGLLIEARTGKITIIEAKYQHVSSSYFQLVEKYLPLCRKVFGKAWTYHTCTVVKWYDASTAYPVRVRLRRDISNVSPGEVAVHIWNPR